MRDLRYPDALAAPEHADWLGWLEVGRKSERTLNGYSLATEPLLATHPTVPFTGFTDSHLLQVLKQLGRTNGDGSMKAIVAAYQSWFKWGVKTRRRIDNPCDLLPTFKRPRPSPVQTFTVAEEAMLESLPYPDGQLVTVLFELGARREEACHLRSGNFNLDTRQATVLGKGDKERLVGISEKLGVAIFDLRMLEGLTPDCYLWPTRPGGTQRNHHDRPKILSGLHRWWVTCCTQAGVEYRSLHKTRHTFAVRWRQRGLPLEDIQELLGHEDPSTTKRYATTRPQDILARMDKLTSEVST